MIGVPVMGSHKEDKRMFDPNQLLKKGGICGLFGVLAISLVLLTPIRAEARRGLVLITRGDDISTVADIPSQLLPVVKQLTGAADPKIGYKYSMFGVFFLNLWTWGGDYVIYQDDTFWDLGETGAAQMLGIDVDALKKPFFYTMPPGLMILLLLGAGGFVFFTFVSGSDD